MNNKRIIMYIGIILFILIIIAIGYAVYINENNGEELMEEYIPQEEISDEQLRKTIVTLYFMDVETGKLISEARQIDVKDLINAPYKLLIELLIEGPKNETMLGLIPMGTILNEAKLIGNIVYVNFSQEFIKDQNLGKDKEMLIIKSIVNTLTELIEVDAVAITIEGETNIGFPDGEVTFILPFTRQE